MIAAYFFTLWQGFLTGSTVFISSIMQYIRRSYQQLIETLFSLFCVRKPQVHTSCVYPPLAILFTTTNPPTVHFHIIGCLEYNIRLRRVTPGVAHMVRHCFVIILRFIILRFIILCFIIIRLIILRFIIPCFIICFLVFWLISRQSHQNQNFWIHEIWSLVWFSLECGLDCS